MNPSTFVGISHGTLLLQGENPGNLVYFRPHTQWDGVVICGSHRFSPCCMACGGGLLPPSLLCFQGLESYHCGSRHGVFISLSSFGVRGLCLISSLAFLTLVWCRHQLPLLSLREWLDPNRRFQGSFARLSASFYSFNPSCLLFCCTLLDL